MNQTLCFVVNHVEIYLEQVLVENDGVPILFVGKSNERRYLILCVDMDVLRYFAVRISRKDLSDLLQGTVPMRDIFLRQAKVCLHFIRSKQQDRFCNARKVCLFYRYFKI